MRKRVSYSLFADDFLASLDFSIDVSFIYYQCEVTAQFIQRPQNGTEPFRTLLLFPDLFPFRSSALYHNLQSFIFSLLKSLYSLPLPFPLCSMFQTILKISLLDDETHAREILMATLN